MMSPRTTNPRLRRTTFILASIFLVGPGGCSSAPSAGHTEVHRDIPARELNALIDTEVSTRGVPGLTLAVEQRGQRLLVEARGKATFPAEVMTAQTVVRIGSVTKSFTAVAILQLVEEGKLQLNDRLGQFLQGLPQHHQQLSVRQLMGQTSGVPDYVDRLEASPALERTDQSFSQLLALVAHKPLRFPAGTRWSYSNTNYLLLGRLIEAVSRTPWEKFIANHQLRPAGLRSTSPCWQLEDRPLASGYTRSGEAHVAAPEMSTRNAHAAGSFCSTPLDLIRWMRALVSGKFVGRRLLEEAWSDQLLPDGTPVGYGFGFGLGHLGPHRLIGHAGGIRGFSSCLLYQRDMDTIVAVVMNEDGATAVELARRILLVLGPVARPPTAVAPPPDVIGRYLLLGQMPTQVAVKDKGITVTLGKTRLQLWSADGRHFCPDQGCASAQVTFVGTGETRGFLLDKDGIGIGARKVKAHADSKR